mgnify:CR=1 FL=1
MLPADAGIHLPTPEGWKAELGGKDGHTNVEIITEPILLILMLITLCDGCIFGAKWDGGVDEGGLIEVG